MDLRWRRICAGDPSYTTSSRTAVCRVAMREGSAAWATPTLATRIAAWPQVTVAEVVADSADDHARLDALSQGIDQRTAVRAVFDYSYQRLTADQAQLFRRLGLHPDPEISVHAAWAAAPGRTS